MEITYIGHSCFKIKGKEISFVIDPYDPKIGFKLPKLEADVLLCSHSHVDHHNVSGVSGYRLLVDAPGEYEISNAFVRGFYSFHDDKNGAKYGKNVMFLIEVDGLSVLHLGDLGHELSKEMIEKLPDIDVLMIPVGGKYTINAETAVEVISEIEPGFVIPMHYKTAELKDPADLADIEEFKDEMGLENNIKKSDKLKITSKSDIPSETEVVILDPAH